MSIIFVLIPILAAIAILCGCKARLTALIASGLTVILGLGSVFCWKVNCSALLKLKIFSVCQ